jgi:hypothetical protein
MDFMKGEEAVDRPFGGKRLPRPWPEINKCFRKL